MSYDVLQPQHIVMGVGAESALGARYFCSKICVLKINKMPQFYMIFARKCLHFS